MPRIGGSPDKKLVPDDFKAPSNPSTPATEREFHQLKEQVVDQVQERNKLVDRYQQLMDAEPVSAGSSSPEHAAWQAQVNQVANELKSIDTDLDTWLSRIMSIGPPPDMRGAVTDLQAIVKANINQKVDPSDIKRMITLEHAKSRDTIYILYGYLEEHSINREMDRLKPVIEKFEKKGYKVVVDRETTYEDWSKYMQDQKMAGLIWSSHGWVSHAPGDSDPDHLMSRVWTTRAVPGTKKIFATEWAEKCPDNLAFLVMASCGTGGVYDKFHEYCEDFSHRSRSEQPTRMISFADTLREKSDHLITYYGPNYGVFDRYDSQELVDALYDRSKLERDSGRSSGGGLRRVADYLLGRPDDD